jgi:myosin heavy subunit
VYQPSCEDVRCRIMVEVQALDPHDGTGTALAITPKMLLDGLVRKNLENILQQGYAKFVVSYLHDSLYDKVMDANIEITKDLLKLNVLSSEGVDRSFHCSYGVGSPQIILHLSDCKRLILVLDSNQPKITLQCLSRTSRDLIVMCMRVFSIENYLLHSKALENISIGHPPYTNIEVALELDEVVLQLDLLSQENFELKNERIRHKKELGDMEKEMENTIEAYKTLVGCNNSDFSIEMNSEMEKIKNELNDAVENKQQARKKLREKEAEVKKLKKVIEDIHESQQNLVWELNESRISMSEFDPSQYEAKIKNIELEYHTKSEQYTESLKLIDGLNEKILVLEAELSQTTMKNKELQSSIVEHSSLLQELSQFKNQNEALLGQRSLLSKRIETLQTEFNELKARAETEQAGYRESNQRLEEENLKFRRDIERLQEERKNDPNSSALIQAQEEVIRYRQQCDNLAGQLSRTQAQLRKK